MDKLWEKTMYNFFLRDAQWWSGLYESAKDPQDVLKPIYKLGLPTLYTFCLTEAHEWLDGLNQNARDRQYVFKPLQNLELPALYLVQQEIINCL